MAIYRCARRGLVDLSAVKLLAITVLPAAVIGALVSHRLPEDILRMGYGMMMLMAAGLLLKRIAGPRQQGATLGGSRKGFTGFGRTAAGGHLRCRRVLDRVDFDGDWRSHGAGLIARSSYAVPVAVATSIVLVAIADISAVLRHMAQFVDQEGLAAVPWNLSVWGVPGMAAGAYLGTSLQG